MITTSDSVELVGCRRLASKQIEIDTEMLLAWLRNVWSSIDPRLIGTLKGHAIGPPLEPVSARWSRSDVEVEYIAAVLKRLNGKVPAQTGAEAQPG